MSNTSNILSYYRDCYKEDSAELNLWNLNKFKQDDCLILEGVDELGSGFLPRLTIPQLFAEQMMQRVDVYQRERVLLYASFMLVGKLEIKGEMKQVAAPLLFNEAVIEKDQHNYYFSVNNQTPEINESLIQLLLPDHDIAALCQDKQDIQSPSFWTALLSKSPLKLDTLTLLDFPKLVNGDVIKKGLRKKIPSLLPASMLVFVERSATSRGVLHELEEIINAKKLSPPLAELFTASDVTQTISSKKITINHQNLKYDYLPGLLSTPQKKVISIAANASLGCVSGPPGTGKSYTISAIAAEHMSRGESVLIVANNEPALEVISEKLDQNFNLGDVSIRAGQKAFIKTLKLYIADLLAGYLSDEDSNDLHKYESDLRDINSSLRLLETRFLKYCRKAIVRGQRLKGLEDNQSSWLMKLYLVWAKKGIRELVTQWNSLNDINTKHLEREKLASYYLNALKNKHLKTLVETHRSSLQAFNKAIRSRTSKRQFELFDDIEFPALLSAFPVWLVSLNTLHRVLPLNAEMFDLVIIDEATQCNVSSTLPALYRAKRAIVVGDTKQLKHYSFLAKSKEQQLMDNHNISLTNDGVVSYRDNSILHLTLNRINNHHQLAFLDEHFRSKPQLINFSNVAFYQNKLKVMQHRPCTSAGHLHIERTSGIRDKKGVNHIESAKIIESIKAQITDDIDSGLTHSIGVISPFSHQAEHLAKEIESHFSATEIKKYKLRAATPYGFQGEERDIMLISFAIDNDSKRAAVYLNKADVFNVTITRAREKQVLFLSIDENLLPENNLLKQYIGSISEFEAKHSVTSNITEFQQQIITELKTREVTTWAGYSIAGTDIDILCEHNGVYLALDLIGFPGPWADFFELNTYKIFKRADIEVLPISYGLWSIDKQACIEKIITTLNSPHNE